MSEGELLFERLEPQSPGQKELKEALESDKDLIGVFGPTGTGKSLFSLAYGISSVLKGEYSRFILARPVVDVATGQEITVTSNPEMYRRIASEYIDDIIGSKVDARKLIDNGKIILIDPHFLRGRTFDNSVIVLDDTQSVKPETVVEIITRLGSNSKLIIVGDPVFQRTGTADGATLAREILLGEETAIVVDLGVKDIVRPGAKRGIKLLLELQMRKRALDSVEEKVVESVKVYAPDADVVTVLNLVDAKRKWEIESEHVPDALIIVKEGYMGRLIGTGGERIASIEEDTGLKLRSIELTLDFKELIRAVHPVSWIYKHIVDLDFAGPVLRLQVPSRHIGPLVGQRGMYIKFIDEVFNKLIGIGVRVVEVEERRRRRRR
ncbi:MAG: PhoH family protein [Desulfurococcales archaeon]|nr:PhoH family protein [Desulfurococcales archaeon]